VLEVQRHREAAVNLYDDLLLVLLGASLAVQLMLQSWGWAVVCVLLLAQQMGRNWLARRDRVSGVGR
jgi:Na+/glutamate symporter